jgi:hypothetical protein
LLIFIVLLVLLPFHPSPFALLHSLLQFSLPLPSAPITSLFPPFFFSYNFLLVFPSLLILYPPPLYTLLFLHVFPLFFLLLPPPHTFSRCLFFLFLIFFILHLPFFAYSSSSPLSMHFLLVSFSSPARMAVLSRPEGNSRDPDGAGAAEGHCVIYFTGS